MSHDLKCGWQRRVVVLFPYAKTRGIVKYTLRFSPVCCNRQLLQIPSGYVLSFCTTNKTCMYSPRLLLELEYTSYDIHTVRD